MNKVLLIIGLFLISLSSSSQNWDQKLDSLFTLLSHTSETDIETQIQLHIKICRASSQDNPQLTLEHGPIAFNMAKANNDLKSQATALNIISVAYSRLGNKESALSNIMEALSLSQELGNDTLLGTILNSIGSIYLQNKEFDKAEPYFIESLQIKNKINDYYGVILSNGNLAAVYADNKKYDLSLEYLEKSILLADSIESDLLLAVVLENKAEVLARMGNIEEAIKFYEQARLGFEEFDNTYNVILTLRDYSAALLKAEKYDACIEKATEGLAMAKMMQLKSKEMELSGFLAKAYTEIGDIPNSHKHQTQYIRLSDSLHIVEKEANVARMEIIYKIKQKDDEIALKDKSLLEYERKQFVNRLVWWLVALTIMLLSAFSYIIYLRLKGRIKSLSVEMVDKDKAIADVALSVVNKGDIIDSVANEKFRSGSIIDTNKLEEHIIANHNQFISNLSKKYPDLSKKEIRICSLIKLQLSSKEIGDVLNLSSKSVDTYRYKIRKIMGLSSKDSMSKFMDEI